MIQIIQRNEREKEENIPFSVLRHPLGPNEHVARTCVTSSA